MATQIRLIGFDEPEFTGKIRPGLDRRGCG
jgi:hypothetical protein